MVENMGENITKGNLIKFEGEFKHGKYIDFRKHRINYFEFSLNQENLISDTPVLFIGGLGRTASAYKEEILDLVNSGRKVIFINPKKGIEAESDDEYLRAQGKAAFLPEVILNKTREIMMLVKRLGIDRADVVGHSQGAAVGTAFSRMLPNLTHKLVLLNPAGMHGDDSAFELVNKSMRQTKHESGRVKSFVEKDGREIGEKSRLGSAHTRAMNSFSMGNPLWTLTKEVPAVAEVDILPILEELKLIGRTEINLVTSNQDVLFPARDIEKNLQKQLGTNATEDLNMRSLNYLHFWHFYADKNASHNAPLYEKPGLLRTILNQGLEQKK